MGTRPAYSKEQLRHGRRTTPAGDASIGSAALQLAARRPGTRFNSRVLVPYLPQIPPLSMLSRAVAPPGCSGTPRTAHGALPSTLRAAPAWDGVSAGLAQILAATLPSWTRPSLDDGVLGRPTPGQRSQRRQPPLESAPWSVSGQPRANACSYTRLAGGAYHRCPICPSPARSKHLALNTAKTYKWHCARRSRLAATGR